MVYQREAREFKLYEKCFLFEMNFKLFAAIQVYF